MPSPRLYRIPGGSSNGMESVMRVSDGMIQQLAPDGTVVWNGDLSKVKGVQYYEARILHMISRRLDLYDDEKSLDTSHMLFSVNQQVTKVFFFLSLSRAAQTYYRLCVDVLQQVEAIHPGARAVRGFSGSLRWWVLGGGAASVAASFVSLHQAFPHMSARDAFVRGISLLVNPKLWDALPQALVPAALCFCLGLPYVFAALVTRSSSVADLRVMLRGRIVGDPAPEAVERLPPDAD